MRTLTLFVRPAVCPSVLPLADPPHALKEDATGSLIVVCNRTAECIQHDETQIRQRTKTNAHVGVISFLINKQDKQTDKCRMACPPFGRIQCKLIFMFEISKTEREK